MVIPRNNRFVERPTSIGNLFAIVMCGLGGCIPLCNGEEDITKWYINPALGQQLFDANRGHDEAIVAVLGLERRITPNLAAELRIFNGDTDANNNHPVLDQQVMQGSVNLNYYLNNELTFSPFLSAGIGNSSFSSGSNRSDEVFASIGLGSRYIINSHWSLRGDVNVFHGHKSNHNDILVSFGISYSFGQIDYLKGSSKHSAVKTAQCQINLIDCVATPTKSAPVKKPKEVNLPAQVEPTMLQPAIVASTTAEQPTMVGPTTRDVWMLLFSVDSSLVDSRFKAEIDEIASILKNSPHAIVHLDGYTDSSGSDDYNLRLSERRVKAVRQIFIDEHGFDIDRFIIVAHGEQHPIADEMDEQGRQSNRRVSITFEGL